MRKEMECPLGTRAPAEALRFNTAGLFWTAAFSGIDRPTGDWDQSGKTEIGEGDCWDMKIIISAQDVLFITP